MKVRWSGQANRDLLAARDYLRQHTVVGVRTVMGRIRERVASLRDNPRIGPAVTGRDARLLAITGTEYIVYYRIDPEEIVVLRLLHGAQQRPDEFG